MNVRLLFIWLQLRLQGRINDLDFNLRCLWAKVVPSNVDSIRSVRVQNNIIDPWQLTDLYTLRAYPQAWGVHSVRKGFHQILHRAMSVLVGVSDWDKGFTLFNLIEVCVLNFTRELSDLIILLVMGKLRSSKLLLPVTVLNFWLTVSKLSELNVNV